MSYPVRIVCTSHDPELVIFDELNNSPPYWGRDNLPSILKDLRLKKELYERIKELAYKGTPETNIAIVDDLVGASDIAKYEHQVHQHYLKNTLLPHAECKLRVYIDGEEVNLKEEK